MKLWWFFVWFVFIQDPFLSIREKDDSSSFCCLAGNRKLETTSRSYACRENALIHSSTRLLSITLTLSALSFWVDKHRYFSLLSFVPPIFSVCDCFPVFVHILCFSLLFSSSSSSFPSSSSSLLTYYQPQRSTDNKLLNHFVVYRHSNIAQDKKRDREWKKKMTERFRSV